MTPAQVGTPLAGIGILVTRPREQAEALASRLRALGADPVLFPALAILPPQDNQGLEATLVRLEQFHLAIFISPSAAQRGLAAVKSRRAWPPELAVAAVGKGTAKALQELGIHAVLEPDAGADSEHLLALPPMQAVAGKRVIIFRGEGGREHLADTLRQRGAQVSYAECYRRGLPERADPRPVLDRFAQGRIQAVTAYSSETLDNLIHLLGEAGLAPLRATPLFVPHARIAEHAHSLGFTTVLAGTGAESQLIDRLVEYFAHEH